MYLKAALALNYWLVQQHLRDYWQVKKIPHHDSFFPWKCKNVLSTLLHPQPFKVSDDLGVLLLVKAAVLLQLV